MTEHTDLVFGAVCVALLLHTWNTIRKQKSIRTPTFCNPQPTEVQVELLQALSKIKPPNQHDQTQPLSQAVFLASKLSCKNSTDWQSDSTDTSDFPSSDDSSGTENNHHHRQHQHHTRHRRNPLPRGPIATLALAMEEEERKLASVWYSTTDIPANLLAFIANLALRRAQGARPQQIHLLQNTNNSVCFSQQEIAELLASAFFGVFSPQSQNFNNEGKLSFERWTGKTTPTGIEKIRCLGAYFARFREIETMPSAACWNKHSTQGKVLFVRKSVPVDDLMDLHDWRTSRAPLLPLKFLETGSIFDEINDGCLQVDFANRNIGGGVLHGGCGQEEILFTTHPECMMTISLCEPMLPNEAIVVLGCEKFCTHTGEGNGFAFAGSCNDVAPLTKDGVRCRAVVVIDAVPFAHNAQYHARLILRELNKCDVGFRQNKIVDHVIGPFADVVSGNWGGGDFGGDSQLKSLIQWAAASQNKRRFRYCHSQQNSNSSPPLLTQLPHTIARVCEGKTVGWLCTQLFNLQRGMFFGTTAATTKNGCGETLGVLNSVEKGGWEVFEEIVRAAEKE